MAPIYTIDSLMNQGLLKFSEACKCYCLVREGWSAEYALHIINRRNKKKEDKKLMKNKKKNNKDLNQLLKELENQISLKYGDGWLVENNQLGMSIFDAMLYVDEGACAALNTPSLARDTKDLMESNQDSLGMWS